MTAETEIDEVPVALYRLYSPTGVLLYIGITDQLKIRLATHAKEKPWWADVARKTVTWYPAKLEAADAEAMAIRGERPIHNVVEPALLSERRPGLRNKHPLLGWHPPTELSMWVRTEAKRQGRPLSDLLTEALEEYRRQLTG